MQIRTDLAAESVAQNGQYEGISVRHRGTAFRITEIEIDTDEHGAAVGRTKGRYLTLEQLGLHHSAPEQRQQVAELADELRGNQQRGGLTNLVRGIVNANIHDRILLNLFYVSNGRPIMSAMVSAGCPARRTVS